ncbi:MAG: hypothetical protein OEU68_00615 [Nitrospira sp.]|nr:hypothetical protein [Nitrospira sp.]MDH4242981.1 hypothetical protein [Nitrospira sp.]MDH4354394.1 hypothetical protein [Nitrospira sp.]MDH5317189.1 hypothetical protein [Nitrospira sp.]
MLTKTRQHIAQVLTSCCAVLWLTGFLSVGQGNLTAQWTAPHCPQGQTQNGQQSHNHCAWHCGGLDIRSGGGRSEATADIQVSLVWSLGAILLPVDVVDSQFPPRGPPRVLFQIA